MARPIKRRLRRRALQLIKTVDQTPRRRRAVSRILAPYYRRRGASAVILDDAVRTAGSTPIATTRSAMRWSGDVRRRRKAPTGFRPERMLTSDEARTEALRLLDARLREVDDPILQRQRFGLLRDRGPEDPDLRRFVIERLETRLATKATALPGAKALDPEAGFETLSRLHDLLSEHGIRPFLVSGTLLGLVRRGGLLPHDYDLDIGTLPGDSNAVEVGRILATDPAFTITVEEHRVWGTHRNGVSFDVFIHWEERDRYYHATRIHSWWNSPFGLVAAAMGGKTFWIPDDTDTYLTENYGTWQSPIAFYHKSFDTPNREYLPSSDALIYLYEITHRAIGRKDRFTAESGSRELARTFGIDVRHHFGDSALLDDDADIARRFDPS